MLGFYPDLHIKNIETVVEALPQDTNF